MTFFENGLPHSEEEAPQWDSSVKIVQLAVRTMMFSDVNRKILEEVSPLD